MKESDFIVRGITNDLLARATPIAKDLDLYNTGRNRLPDSIAYTESAVADLVLADYLKATYNPNTNFDMVFTSTSGMQVRVDNKTQILKAQPQPRLYYEGDVLAYNVYQTADVYAFSTVNMNYRVCTLVGWLTHKDFMTKSTLIPAGSTRPNGIVFRKPSYVIGYKDVNPMQTLKSLSEEG
jgi:hypothetical protein